MLLGSNHSDIVYAVLRRSNAQPKTIVLIWTMGNNTYYSRRIRMFAGKTEMLFSLDK